MIAIKSVLLAALVAMSFVPAAAQEAVERKVEQYTCKDVMREGGTSRDTAIAFLHGFLLGQSGRSVFNVEILAKQTDAFIDYCLDNPNAKAMEAMTKVKT
jgi:hypothetical protein